jgi:hypothetical protein
VEGEEEDDDEAAEDQEEEEERETKRQRAADRKRQRGAVAAKAVAAAAAAAAAKAEAAKAKAKATATGKGKANGKGKAKAGQRVTGRPQTSIYRGVHWNKAGSKWIGSINDSGKNTHLGGFQSETDAARAYDAAAKDIHGPNWGCFNFPVAAPATKASQKASQKASLKPAVKPAVKPTVKPTVKKERRQAKTERGQPPSPSVKPSPSPPSRATSYQSGHSGYRGVSWAAAEGCWQAKVGHAGTFTHLGVFEDDVDAARAYDRAALRLHGWQAHRNFGREGPRADTKPQLQQLQQLQQQQS